jgi:hypothetical protein
VKARFFDHLGAERTQELQRLLELWYLRCLNKNKDLRRPAQTLLRVVERYSKSAEIILLQIDPGRTDVQTLKPRFIQ